jgi:hypothetical protein
MTAQAHRAWWVVALLVVGTAAIGGAQQAPARDGVRPAITGTASLVGTVVADDEAHRPIPHVVLTLSTAGLGGHLTTATDEAGHYLFAGLPADVYTLAAARGAYLTASYGALAPGALPLPIPLKDGQQFVADPIVLVKGSVIAGRLTDPDGRPVAGARVNAVNVVTVGGERRPGSVQYGHGDAISDSRGLYRIYGLAAGDYLVGSVAPMTATPIVLTSAEQVQWADSRAAARTAPVGPPPAHPRPFAWAPTIFPGVVDVGAAAVVTLGRADERADVDFSLLQVGIVRVTGTVYGLDSTPMADAIVLPSLKHVSNLLAFSGSTGPVRSTRDGSFALAGLTPGQYTITVRASAAGTTAAGPANLSVPAGPLTLWGQAEVSVGGDDLDGVAIHLQPGMTVAGSLVFEGSAPPPEDLARFKPRLVPVEADAPNVTVDLGGGPSTKADRSFALEGVMPGSYVLTGVGSVPTTAGSGPVWTVRSIVAGGRDLLNAPFDVHPREDISNAVVTYSDRHSALEGQLINAAGQPVSQYRVLVFSSNHDQWLPSVLPRWMAAVRAGVDGSFRIVGLPAGEYYVCALLDGAQPPPADEAFLSSLAPAAIKIVLADGETHRQTFKVGG